MGLLAKVLPRAKSGTQVARKSTNFNTFTEYSPVFTTWGGSLYEQQLTRATVERIALAASKLKPEVQGTAEPRVRRAIRTTPNDYMTWAQLCSRVATILYVDTTAFVVPSFDSSMNVTGVWPLKCSSAEVVEYGGEPWVLFHFDGEESAALELKYVCILTRFQYHSDFFGDGNAPLDPTLKLVHAQDEAQEQAIKNGATIRWIGKLGSSVRGDDMAEKRKKFSEDNLSATFNDTGLMVYDNTWDSIQQVEPQSYTVDTEEMERIQQNVYTYFGINEGILTNDFTEEQWGAWYESVIEPFAVQLGDGLTRILYSPRERSTGNRISFSSNRLEYASNASKRNMIRDISDRAIMSVNDAREILQMPPIPGGDVYMMRGEYYLLDKDFNLVYASGGDEPRDYDDHLEDDDSPEHDLGGDDDIYNDNDSRGSEDEEDGV